MAGFMLQPACIPSSDPSWECVAAVDSWGHNNYPALLESAAKTAKRTAERITHIDPTSHETLAKLKRLCEETPIASAFTLPGLRRAYSLPPRARTWSTLRAQDVPLIIPVRPGTFARPRDWGARREPRSHARRVIGRALLVPQK